MNISKYLNFPKTGFRPFAIDTVMKGNKVNGPIGLLFPIIERRKRGVRKKISDLISLFLKEKIPSMKNGSRIYENFSYSTTPIRSLG